MKKLYKIQRNHALYVLAESPEGAKECAEYDETVYEEYKDGEPQEVSHVDTGLGTLFADDFDEDYDYRWEKVEE